jgi:hypothetical protein
MDGELYGGVLGDGRGIAAADSSAGGHRGRLVQQCIGRRQRNQYTGATYPGTWSNAAGLRPTFTGCTVAGLPATARCNTTGAPITLPASFNAVSANPSAGLPVISVNGNISGIGCSVAVTGCIITVLSTGTGGHAVDALYTNPTAPGNATTLRVYGNTATHPQTLTSSWPNTSTCNAIFGTTAGGSAASYFGASTNNAGGYPDDLVYTVLNGPIYSH